MYVAKYEINLFIGGIKITSIQFQSLSEAFNRLGVPNNPLTLPPRRSRQRTSTTQVPTAKTTWTTIAPATKYPYKVWQKSEIYHFIGGIETSIQFQSLSEAFNRVGVPNNPLTLPPRRSRQRTPTTEAPTTKYTYPVRYFCEEAVNRVRLMFSCLMI